MYIILSVRSIDSMNIRKTAKINFKNNAFVNHGNLYHWNTYPFEVLKTR